MRDVWWAKAATRALSSQKQTEESFLLSPRHSMERRRLYCGHSFARREGTSFSRRF